MMRFERTIAWRHLRTGGGTTILIILAVAIATMVIIFVNGSIAGMSKKLMGNQLRTLAHITLEPKDIQPTPLENLQAASRSDRIYTSEPQQTFQQSTRINNGGEIEAQIRPVRGLTTVMSQVKGNAFALKGSKRESVTLIGADPEQQERLISLKESLLTGRWPDIAPDEVVVGMTLAEKLRLQLGDRVRIQSSEGVTQIFRVAGFFYTGSPQSDEREVYIPLRAAQSLFAMGAGVSQIAVKLDDAFAVDKTGPEIRAMFPRLKVKSWLDDNEMMTNGMRTQTAIRSLLTSFMLITSSCAIAAVLIVSVLQKSKQIGILKSMGASEQQILRIFTMEGLGVAVIGGLVGCIVAYILLSIVDSVTLPGRYGRVDKLAPVALDLWIVIGAFVAVVLATVLAAQWPARRASRLDPVEVLRG
ncbi:ABC transporter permease [Armatimonas sp.]|uniref:ABC transporter permease n=1 Tax=Armatimonas sp. TaxID=1872638 RepID=UPI00286B6BB8|nr:ABC transporter permease [Armatimonas sp.]